jgi:hypothetical protein
VAVTVSLPPTSWVVEQVAIWVDGLRGLGEQDNTVVPFNVKVTLSVDAVGTVNPPEVDRVAVKVADASTAADEGHEEIANVAAAGLMYSAPVPGLGVL